ncbi:MAG: N-acetylmuramoyl-L-alanine amidase [Bacteroidota bacterium]
MINIIAALQTILLATSPLATAEFNTSFSADPISTLIETDHQLDHFNDSTFLESVAFAFKKTQNRRNLTDKKAYEIKTVVIDPGHGGHDSGCRGGNSKEKHLALGIAMKLAIQLRTNYPNLKIIMTRDKDVFIPLYERARIANRNEADLFISIHCNYFPAGSRTRGTETYVMGLHTAEHNLNVAKRENSAILLEEDYETNYDYDPNSPEGHIMLSMFQNAYLEQSILFANMVEKNFASSERRSRGVKQAGFVVLKETAMPSVLVETGFLSNYKEEQFLMTEKGQTTIAKAIAKAFGQYKTEVEKNNFFTETDLTPINPLADNNKSVKSTQELEEEDIFNPVDEPQLISTKQPQAPKGVEVTPSTITAESNVSPQIIPSTSVNVPSRAKEVTKKSTADEDNAIYQFYIQLLATPNPVNTKQGLWSKVKHPIEVHIEGNYYKYRARGFDTYSKATAAQLELTTLGFDGAFIIAFRNGVKVPIQSVPRK